MSAPAPNEKSPDVLVARMTRLEDERQIHELIAQLSHVADRGTVDEYLDLWVPHGEWYGSTDVARGTDALRERVERYRAAGVQGPGSGTKHVSTTRVIEISGPDTARADSYFVYFAGLPADPKAVRVGRYDDLAVRWNGRWRLARRRIVLDD